MKQRQITSFLVLVFTGLLAIAHGQDFVHPGLLHGRDDLERIKKAVAAKEGPIYAGYQLFIQNPVSQYSYAMQGPLPMVGRNATVGQTNYDNDANAAHQNAVLWAITGDKRYADKAIEIVNAWSRTLKSITGRDAVLMAGLGPFKMVNAAEILRYTNAGWSAADIQQAEKHFREVIFPVLKDFAPFANGNWDAAAIKTVMAIAVFCNDRPMFERALHYYIAGGGNGRLTNYIINEEGQVQESGRDQAHTQLGIGLLAESCEIAWKQGLDLYRYADNRLLKGFEYVAKFNLGNEVPFTEWLDRTGKYHHKQVSQQARGQLRAVYEQVYNHYVNRMGLSAPFTEQAAEMVRPEGPGKPGADHPGYGTLYFSGSRNNMAGAQAPVPPAGLLASHSEKTIRISWIASIGATGYTVKRAVKKGGPYTVVEKNIAQTNFTDATVQPGTVYYYTITASNAKGESANGYEIGIAAGLPSPWKQQDIGQSPWKGVTVFDGSDYAIEGIGVADTSSDVCHFTGQEWKGDGAIVARFLPQPSSQFTTMGLTMRESLDAGAPAVSLLLVPGRSAQIEAPDWHMRLLSRTAVDAKTVVQYGPLLKVPTVTFGRLTGVVWLRLQRKGNMFTGYTSYDGTSWTELGKTTANLKKVLQVGIPVSSGMTNTTTVVVDHVSVTKE